MSLARKIFSNTAWQIFGKIVTAVLGIVSIKLITNYLSRSAYGEYTIIYDYTALFAIIADFGLFTIAVREMAHSNTKEMTEKIVGNVLSIRTALAVLALGLSTLTAFIIPQYSGSHIPFGVLLVSIATILTLIAGTMSSVLQFRLRMHWASIALMGGKLVTVGYIILVILRLFPDNPEAGFPHLLLAWIIGGLLTILITYAASSRLIPIHYRFDFIFWKDVFVKALPYGAALVLGTMYFRMGIIVLSLLDMKDQAGLFGVPLRFLEILQIIPHYFMNSILPVLTIGLKEGGERPVQILKNSINALSGLAFPVFAGGFVLAWPLTAAVSSPDFLSSRDSVTGALIPGSDIALKILLVAMAFTYLHVALSYTLVAMGRQAELLWINALTVTVNVGLNFFLTPRYGFVGAAIAAVAAEIIMFATLVLRVRRRISHVWDFVFLAKMAASAFFMGAVLWLASDFLNDLFASKSLFITIPLGALLFGVAAWTLRAFSPEMLALLKKSKPVRMEE